MMSDFDVEMGDEGTHQFTVMFPGPSESEFRRAAARRAGTAAAGAPARLRGTPG